MVNTTTIRRIGLLAALLLCTCFVTACASTERQTAPPADRDQPAETQPPSETQSQPDTSAGAEEPAPDNPRDREADELRSRDTEAVIEQLDADSDSETAPQHEPNERPGHQHDRAVDQPRPSTRR